VGIDDITENLAQGDEKQVVLDQIANDPEVQSVFSNDSDVESGGKISTVGTNDFSNTKT
jgi:hypothetical protein